MTDPFSSPVFTVGLTGGIASGKSAVSARFEELGVAVIDTDTIARKIVQPGQQALEEVVSSFGREILDESGKLRRRELRRRIFEDPHDKYLLESILHPRIAAEVRERLAGVTSPYCIIVIPLLAESGRYDWLDRVLVVDLPERQQIERLVSRDGVTAQEAEASLASQASREDRLALADDVLDNSGAETELDSSVRLLHQKYLELARKTHPWSPES